MPVELNHTIVAARDRQVSAEFLAHILGLTVGPAWGHFLPVSTANGVTLDFVTVGDEPIASQHYAFLVSDEEFEAVFGRIRAAGIGSGPTRAGSSRGRSTTATGGEGCTSSTRPATSSRC